MTDDQVLDELAGAIVTHHLGSAAVLMLRSICPVTAGQLHVALAPIVAAVAPARAAELQRVLGQPGAAEQLRLRIEARL